MNNKEDRMLNVDNVINLLLIESRWEGKHLLALAKTLKLKANIIYSWLSRKNYPTQKEAKDIIFLDLFLHDPAFITNEIKNHKDRQTKELLITEFERNIQDVI